MSRHRLIDDAITALRAQGLSATVERGKHVKLKFVNEQGRPCTLVAASTPSDHRARASGRAVLRRLLRRSA